MMPPLLYRYAEAKETARNSSPQWWEEDSTKEQNESSWNKWGKYFQKQMKNNEMMLMKKKETPRSFDTVYKTSFCSERQIDQF